MALDHPDAVERLCVLNIVPTVDQFERMAAEAALDYLPCSCLAQPPPFSESACRRERREVVAPHPRRLGRRRPARSPAEATEHYVRRVHARGDRRHLADFRAAFHLDRPLDAADREPGTGSPVRCSCTGAREGSMSDGPLPVWRRWADDVDGGPLPSGHFVPEEAAEALGASLREFLTAAG